MTNRFAGAPELLGRHLYNAAGFNNPSPVIRASSSPGVTMAGLTMSKRSGDLLEVPCQRGA